MESKKNNTEKEFNPNDAVEVTEKLDKVDGGVDNDPNLVTCKNCGKVCKFTQFYCPKCGACLFTSI